MKNQQGFTLMELIVVSGLMVIIIVTVSSLFFSSLKGATKTSFVNETKQNGDFALSTMERMIRNAKNIPNMSINCASLSRSSITIENPDNRTTTFTCPTASEGQIASNSGFLTSSRQAVSVYPAGCFFICSKQGISPAIVKIKFNIHNLSAVVARPEENIDIDYETSVVVRNTGE